MSAFRGAFPEAMAPSKRMIVTSAPREADRKKNQQTLAIVKAYMRNTLEKKVFSVSAVGTAITTAGVVIPITNGIIEGDDIANRQGTVINLLRSRILLRAVGTASHSQRFILFRDMLNLQAFPTTNLLLPTGTWISQYSDVREMQQHRFKIIKDITMDLNVAGRNVVTKEYDIPLKGKVFYNGATAVAASEGPGAYYLLVIGSAVSGSYDYTIQTVFNDA